VFTTLVCLRIQHVRYAKVKDLGAAGARERENQLNQSAQKRQFFKLPNSLNNLTYLAGSFIFVRENNYVNGMEGK
jgi:hypothetical protein